MISSDATISKEDQRLAALDRYQIMDTGRERGFDDLAGLAAEICGTPIAVVNLIASHRQWFKAEVGLGVDSTPLETSFCAKAILEDDFLLVPDATQDERFACNPLVTIDSGLRFYAGALLKSPDGFAIGTLCVLDYEPRQLTEQQQRSLRTLAQQVMAQLNLRLAVLEREEANADLSASEARFRAAIDAVQGILWTNNPLGEMEGEQSGWGGLTGQSLEEYQGFGWTAAVHPNDVQPTVAAWNAAVAAKSVFIFEHRVRRHDGEWRRFAIRAIPTFTPSGDVIEWVGVHTDVTDQRSTEEQLRILNDQLEQRVAEALAERTLLAELVENTDAFVQVVDSSFCWLAINRAAADEFERIYGIRPKVGDCMLELLASWPDHRAAVRDIWARALAGEEFTETGEFGDPGRDRRSYEMKFNALRNADGSQIGAYQFVYDVTERVQEQAALALAEESLRQSQKLEAIGQLTGGVAHDFNNLLTVIRGSIDMIRRGNLSEDRQFRYYDAIADTADRAAKLTSQLLAFARRQALTAAKFETGASLQEVATMLKTMTGTRIKLSLKLPADPNFIVADRSQFDTAIVNLVVNARDAMSGEGHLSISTRTVSKIPSIRGHAPVTGDFVAVSVTDSGVGIPPHQIDRIFEPFFTTKGVGEGTGLGLSQVIGFAKQSGGDIQVESMLGQGTTFTLYLPRSCTEVPPTDVARHDIGSVEGNGMCVLVVEDNEEVGGFASEALAELGYESVLAGDGAAALQKLKTDANRFDVIFSDVVMPGISGIELGRQVRALYPEIPFILTSGYSEVLAQDGDHGFELLHKPYSIEQLSRALKDANELKSRLQRPGPSSNH